MSTSPFTTDAIDTPDFVKNLVNYETKYVIQFLKYADEQYHNTDDPVISDKDYDFIYRTIKLKDPTNEYFIGVGSEVRGGKVTLPYPMGSLNQKYEKDIQEWINSKQLSQKPFIVTDKLDGVSAMVIYHGVGNIKLQIAYSRGDGFNGADCTRHLSKIVPLTYPDKQKSFVIRGEVILTKTGFDILKTKVVSRSGKPYKNARNMVAGLMNAKENDPIVYEYLCFVAYEIVGESMDKMEMLQVLAESDFLTPRWSKWTGKDITGPNLINYVTDRKSNSEYEIDGVVVDVNDMYERNALNPTKETLNPEYSFKFKTTDESNMATAVVTEIELNVSKHGYIKPIIKIEPVELVGATVTKCTGFNMKFISDNYIGPGAIIAITRSGSVIPLITKVITPMPQENM